LSGSLAERSRASISAGCDVVLHCNGNLAEMEEVASAVPVLAGEAKRRADAALALRAAPDEFDIGAARQMFARMIGSAGA
jgi:beta-N-acetylhexosaminidase